MARTGVLFNGSGDIIGHVYCAQDEDLPLQAPANLVEVPVHHPAVLDPRGWTVVIRGGKPVVDARREPPAEPPAPRGGPPR